MCLLQRRRPEPKSVARLAAYSPCFAVLSVPSVVKINCITACPGSLVFSASQLASPRRVFKKAGVKNEPPAERHRRLQQ